MAEGRKLGRRGADVADDERTAKLSAAHDLYLDLLGSLVPGLITVVLGGAAVVLTVDALSYLLGLTGSAAVAPTFQGYLQPLVTLLEKVHWEIAAIAVVSAYIVGSIYFRQDPKRPDALSALLLWIQSKPEDRRGLAAQGAPEDNANPEKAEQKREALLMYEFSRAERVVAYLRPGQFMKSQSLSAEFPYLNLRCYLITRGLHHLAVLLPWCPKVEKKHNIRSKMFINILKIRLFSFYPNLCRDIVRNEAHIRLASSIWYASGTLRGLSSILLLIMVAAKIRGIDLSRLFLPALFVSSVLIFSLFMRVHLRQFVHYMRVREAVYVLEATHVAKQIDRRGIFNDIGRGIERGRVYCAIHRGGEASAASGISLRGSARSTS